MPDPEKTHKLYLRQAWVDPADGTLYEVNDPIHLPAVTDEDLVTIDHLVASGVLGRRPVGDERATDLELEGVPTAVDVEEAHVDPEEPEAAPARGTGKSTRTSTTKSR